MASFIHLPEDLEEGQPNKWVAPGAIAKIQGDSHSNLSVDFMEQNPYTIYAEEGGFICYGENGYFDLHDHIATNPNLIRYFDWSGNARWFNKRAVAQVTQTDKDFVIQLDDWSCERITILHDRQPKNPHPCERHFSVDMLNNEREYFCAFPEWVAIEKIKKVVFSENTVGWIYPSEGKGMEFPIHRLAEVQRLLESTPGLFYTQDLGGTTEMVWESFREMLRIVRQGGSTFFSKRKGWIDQEKIGLQESIEEAIESLINRFGREKILYLPPIAGFGLECPEQWIVLDQICRLLQRIIPNGTPGYSITESGFVFSPFVPESYLSDWIEGNPHLIKCQGGEKLTWINSLKIAHAILLEEGLYITMEGGGHIHLSLSEAQPVLDLLRKA